MGATARGLAEYAEPLIDRTDGSAEQIQLALTITRFCYNLALIAEKDREQMLDDFRPELKMGDAEFAEFKSSVVLPMIERHRKMFPLMHGGLHVIRSKDASMAPSVHSSTAARGEAYPGTDRYAPCPCNSGKKYKFCCGNKSR